SAALVVSAPVALVSSAPAAAQSQSADLANAVAALRAITTMQADFVQADLRGSRLRGVLTLKAPGKIRFQYEKSVPILIVSDGKALTFIDYKVRQVQRWPISNSPLGALLNPRGNAMQYARLAGATNGQIVSVEVRDKKHPEYGVITFVFIRKAGAPGGLELSSWATLDSQNARTVVTLSNQRYGLAVSDNTFRFNDPRTPTRR
ncbi:MAG: outer membrane lipoprotein carrier protein LolA, partial [Novosphingobium sp.]|uniref:LolA family protein n=1 Tax=Novosphingobium sp. TaxID=1874826 RepID=UPI0032BDB427